MNASDLDALLDPENLDVSAVTAAIDASAADETLKSQLKLALTNAQNFPTLLPDVLTRIRGALSGE